MIESMKEKSSWIGSKLRPLKRPQRSRRNRTWKSKRRENSLRSNAKLKQQMLRKSWQPKRRATKWNLWRTLKTRNKSKRSKNQRTKLEKLNKRKRLKLLREPDSSRIKICLIKSSEHKELLLCKKRYVMKGNKHFIWNCGVGRRIIGLSQNKGSCRKVITGHPTS